jgi:hypothetical protein
MPKKALLPTRLASFPPLARSVRSTVGDRSPSGDGLLPPNLKREKGFFEIKVQTAGPTQAVMVYSSSNTKHKEFCFTVEMNDT